MRHAALALALILAGCGRSQAPTDDSHIRQLRAEVHQLQAEVDKLRERVDGQIRADIARHDNMLERQASRLDLVGEQLDKLDREYQDGRRER